MGECYNCGVDLGDDNRELCDDCLHAAPDSKWPGLQPRSPGPRCGQDWHPTWQPFRLLGETPWRTPRVRRHEGPRSTNHRRECLDAECDEDEEEEEEEDEDEEEENEEEDQDDEDEDE